jgi:hypothetical protein
VNEFMARMIDAWYRVSLAILFGAERAAVAYADWSDRVLSRLDRRRPAEPAEVPPDP